MLRTVLNVIAYIVATLIVQGTSHLVLLKAHYAKVDFMRGEPIFALGVASMIIQGIALSFACSRFKLRDGEMANMLSLSWLFGSFIVSYKALAEPGEFQIANVPDWMVVEAGAGFVQFTLIGLLFFAVNRALSPKADTRGGA